MGRCYFGPFKAGLWQQDKLSDNGGHHKHLNPPFLCSFRPSWATFAHFFVSNFTGYQIQERVQETVLSLVKLKNKMYPLVFIYCCPNKVQSLSLISDLSPEGVSCTHFISNSTKYCQPACYYGDASRAKTEAVQNKINKNDIKSAASEKSLRKSYDSQVWLGSKYQSHLCMFVSLICMLEVFTPQRKNIYLAWHCFVCHHFPGWRLNRQRHLN